MFSRDDPYVAVDGDSCIDPATGRLAGEAEDAVFTLNSYTELSARGSGFHTIVEGEKPGDQCRGRLGDIGVEVYSHGRLLAFTGHRLPGTQATVESRQLELEAVYGLVFPRGEAPVPCHVGESVGSDAAVIARAESAKNGAKFKRLWAGDWSGYPSQSEADNALCRLLAYWTGRDRGQMDRLFRQSGLYRDKWDRPESTYGTYGRRTISKVLGDA